MKTLLILAYDFPPYVSVGGLRPYAWYKYLKEYGVYPVVVTRQWANNYGDERDYVAPSKSVETEIEYTEFGTIIRTPYKPNWANRIFLKYGKSKFAIVRKIVSAYYEFAQFLFFVGPKSGLYRGAKQYLTQNKVDAIIATGDPFILFKYAAALSKKYNTPWIADYRDPWIHEGNRNILQQIWDSFFERKYVSSSMQITTVSEFVKFQINSNIKEKLFTIIPNGYNPDAIEKVKNVKQNAEVLSFAFVGTIYSWHPYKSVLNIFNQFAAENIDVKFVLNFYGINKHEEIENLIATDYTNLKPFVHVYPRMLNEDLLQQLAQHNIMLLFNYYSFMGTKIYDYMALKRRIILCYSNDKESEMLKQKYYPLHEVKGLSSHLQEDLLNETDSGVVLENATAFKQCLNDIYAEFKQNGFIECKSHNVEQFSRKEQTKKLADILLNL